MNYGKLPLSLSVETECGLAVKIAEIGEPLPIRSAKVFSTGPDVPETAAVRLYAGERPFVKDNIFLAELKISGISDLKLYGRPVISFVINIDTDCKIDIDVTDEGSLNSTGMIISGDWVPPSDEILRLVKEANDNLGPDNERKSKVTALQNARESLNSLEIKYKNLRKRLPAEKAIPLKRRLNSLKARLKKLKAEDMTEVVEESVSSLVSEMNDILSNAK